MTPAHAMTFPMASSPVRIPRGEGVVARRFDERTVRDSTRSVLGKYYEGQECALASTLEVLGVRWTLLIVRDAFFGVGRYSDWVARLDIPRAVLSDRLRGLVASGILVKRDGQLYEL